MPRGTSRCSICRQTGHNRRTCPQLNTNQNTSQLETRESLYQSRSNNNNNNNISSISESLIRLKNNSKKLIYIIRWINISIHYYEDLSLTSQGAPIDSPLYQKDIRILYFYWLKIKDILNILTKENLIYIASSTNIYDGEEDDIHLLNKSHLECSQYHVKINRNIQSNNFKRRVVKLCNLKDTNYLIYWVIGNYFINDIDSQENNIKYIGLLLKKNSFDIKCVNGHRLYLIPHKLDNAPPYHPNTDKEFFIDPYCQINIHEELEDKIIIDKKDSLSELNQWKFNTLKLDFLIRELIRLGIKDNSNYEFILDLYDDIHINPVTEYEKEISGIPSKLTNIT